MDTHDKDLPSTGFDLSILDILEQQDKPVRVKYCIPKQYTFYIHCSPSNKKKIQDFITVCWYTKLWWTWIQKMSPINNLDPEKLVVQVSGLSTAISWTRKWWESRPDVARLFFSPIFTSVMGQAIKRKAIYTSSKTMVNVSGAIVWVKKGFILYPVKSLLKVYGNNKIDCYEHDFKDGFIYYDKCTDTISLKLKSSHKTEIKQYNRSKYADGRVCGIDPGLLNFLTIYDPSDKRRCIKLGNKTEMIWLRNMVFKEKTYDEMMTPLSDNAKLVDVQREINNIKFTRNEYLDNFYHRICKYLVANYSIIFIGDFCFNVSHRKSTPSNVNENYCTYDVWNHARFYDILLSYQNAVCKVFVMNEQNTSIICSNCGRITPTKNTRTYTCQFCTVILDRDINAACNILQMGLRIVDNGYKPYNRMK